MFKGNMKSSLAVHCLHTELKAKVLLWVYYPVVAGGCYIKHQPPPIGCLDLFRVEQKCLCISERETKRHISVNYPKKTKSVTNNVVQT